MLTRHQKAAMMVALVICFAGAVAGEVWQASNTPHVPAGQSASAQSEHTTDPETIEERHQTTEEAIAYYNKWLMFFTAVLAAATVGLGTATVGLYFASERQLSLAKETADRQAAEIQKQLRLTREYIEFARLEFNATHRPHLVIRETHMLIPTGRNPTAGVRFIVANAGSGAADVIASFVILEFNDAAILLPLQPPDHSNSIGPIRIEPGESVEREFGSNINFPQYTNEQNRQRNHPGEPIPKIWLRGFIAYLDNNRIRRRMAFCRGYDFKASRFRAGDDPNYEYSD
jgi:hypothetical protein